MMSTSRNFQRFILVACLASVWCLAGARVAWAQNVSIGQCDALYEKGLAAYRAGRFEDARQIYDLMTSCPESSGARIWKALIDIRTGKPKTGKTILENELPDAKKDRAEIQDKFDKARSEGKHDRAAKLENDLKRADQRVVDMETSLKVAETLVGKVYVTVPESEREKDLTVLLDGIPVESSWWDGKQAIEVDAGNHTLTASTPRRVGGEADAIGEPEIRCKLTDEATAQKPMRLTVKLGLADARYPVAGFRKLDDELKDRVAVLGNLSDKYERGDIPKHRCYEAAWASLGAVHSQAQALRNASLKESPAGAEDSFEVKMIRRLRQYEIEPCLQDCLNGQTECKPEIDVPWRVWPGRGSCGACAIGPALTSQDDDGDHAEFVASLLVLSLFVIRVRRRDGRIAVGQHSIDAEPRS